MKLHLNDVISNAISWTEAAWIGYLASGGSCDVIQLRFGLIKYYRHSEMHSNADEAAFQRGDISVAITAAAPATLVPLW